MPYRFEFFGDVFFEETSWQSFSGTGQTVRETGILVNHALPDQLNLFSYPARGRVRIWV